MSETAGTNVNGSRKKLRMWLFTLRSKLELRWALLTGKNDWLLRKRFNRWAEWGVGEDMERCHIKIADITLARMNLSSGDRILELGCGEGWASRLMAGMLGKDSRIVGVDIADEMIARASAKSVGIPNLSFLRGSAERIPCEAKSFDKVLSIEAFYYVKNQENALKELSRVLVPNGVLCLLIVFHKDNPQSLNGVEQLGMPPLHYLSAAEYEAMLIKNGWTGVVTEILEVRSQPDGKPDVHDRPLLIMATRPCVDQQVDLDDVLREKSEMYSVGTQRR